MYTIKKAFICSLVALIGSVGVFGIVEPTLLGAQASDSDSVQVSMTVDSGITITDAGNVTMTPNIGISSDTSTAGVTWTVRTNDVDGYSLSVRATTSPALQHSNGTDSFADYTESSSGTPDSWSVDNGAYEFGYSAYGTDIAAGYGSGSSCDGGGDPATTSLNYEGFETSDNQIGSRTTTTPDGGVDSTVCFGAGQNAVYAPSGNYTATVVATATVQ